MPSSQSEPPPPIGGSWKRLYMIELGVLCALIVLFYLFTRAFE